jgi:hypothetical protein
MVSRSSEAAMTRATLLPFQPDAMTPAQLAAVSYLARYTGQTYRLYAYQLRRWFSWCETNALDPLVGLQRAHLELYIRHLHDSGLRDSSINTMLHGVRGFFRFAHIDGLIAADPAVYARLPKIHADEIRTQGLDRLELIRLPRPTQDRTRSDAALSAFCCGCWQEGRTLKGPFGGMTRALPGGAQSHAKTGAINLRRVTSSAPSMQTSGLRRGSRVYPFELRRRMTNTSR